MKLYQPILTLACIAGLSGCVELKEGKVLQEYYSSNAYVLTIESDKKIYVADVKKLNDYPGGFSIDALEKIIEVGSIIRFTDLNWYNGDGFNEDNIGILYTHRIKLISK